MHTEWNGEYYLNCSFPLSILFSFLFFVQLHIVEIRKINAWKSRAMIILWYHCLSTYSALGPNQTLYKYSIIFTKTLRCRDRSFGLRFIGTGLEWWINLPQVSQVVSSGSAAGPGLTRRPPPFHNKAPGHSFTPPVFRLRTGNTSAIPTSWVWALTHLLSAGLQATPHLGPVLCSHFSKHFRVFSNQWESSKCLQMASV